MEKFVSVFGGLGWRAGADDDEHYVYAIAL